MLIDDFVKFKFLVKILLFKGLNGEIIGSLRYLFSSFDFVGSGCEYGSLDMVVVVRLERN